LNIQTKEEIIAR
jgi:transcriptional accessory protein Tex/SPT6